MLQLSFFFSLFTVIVYIQSDQSASRMQYGAQVHQLRLSLQIGSVHVLVPVLTSPPGHCDHALTKAAFKIHGCETHISSPTLRRLTSVPAQSHGTALSQCPRFLIFIQTITLAEETQEERTDWENSQK